MLKILDLSLKHHVIEKGYERSATYKTLSLMERLSES